MVEGGFRHCGDVVVAVGAGRCYKIFLIVVIIIVMIICDGGVVGVSVHPVFFMCDENSQNRLRKGEIGRHMVAKREIVDEN